MLTRRTFARLAGASALAAGAGLHLPGSGTARAQSAPPSRGTYLIRNGAVITVDNQLGVLPRGDVLVRDGRIEAVATSIEATGAEVIDATDMIVMPGFIDTHYHMWSAIGRNFVGDGFGYFAAKNATSKLFQPEDFYNSVMLGLAELANAGITTVHNWSHNTRSPAHADAELRAHRQALLRARYSYGHVDLMPRDQLADLSDIPRIKKEYFTGPGGTAFDGLAHLGVNLRGTSQSEAATFHEDMKNALGLDVPISLHAGQAPPNVIDAVDFEKRGWVGPKFLFCHYVPARDVDAEIMARTNTPLSWASHSEFRLGANGDPRAAIMRMRKAGVTISLSFDATSIAPPNMFENMRFIWNMGIPWRATPTEKDPPVAFREAIQFATLNGAKALALDKVTGSLTPGKRADLILIRGNDINMAPVADIEASVVQSGSPANVDTVMVDGRIVKRAGRLVAYDVERIVAKAKESALRIRVSAGGRLAPKL